MTLVMTLVTGIVTSWLSKPVLGRYHLTFKPPVKGKLILDKFDILAVGRAHTVASFTVFVDSPTIDCRYRPEKGRRAFLPIGNPLVGSRSEQ